MAKLGLIETIQTKLSTLSKTDGQLIVVRDNASLYVDLNGSRVYISDWIDVSTDTERLSMLTPLNNKYYYVIETNKIWRYVSGTWVQITSHNADSIVYDNTTSGLNATDVNSAIDEIVNNVEHLETDVNNLKSTATALTSEVTVINGKIATINESIVNIQSDIEENKNAIEDLQSAKDITTTSSTTLENSNAGRVKFNEIVGGMEQDSTEGNQLFDASATPYQKTHEYNFDKESGAYSFETTAQYPNRWTIEVKQNTDITFSVESMSDNVTVQLSGTDIDKRLRARNTLKSTFNTLENNELTLSIFAETDGSFEVNGLIVSYDADATYEPFTNGASPNPDYQQPINGSVIEKVRVHHKNFLDCNNLTEAVSHDITFTPVKDNYGRLEYVNANGTSTNHAIFDIQRGTLKLPKGSYKVNGISGGSLTTYYMQVYRTVDDTAQLIGSLEDGDLIFSIDEDTYIWVRLLIVSGQTVSGIKFYPMIRRADIEDSTCEPYQGKEISLSQPITLYGDVLTPQNVERKYKAIVLNGNEEWILQSAGTENAFFEIITTDKLRSRNALCTYFIHTEVTSGNTNIGFANNSSGSTIRFRPSNVATWTLESWKEWLANNNMKVVYPLAEPTTEELPTIDRIALNSLPTYDGITYVEFVDVGVIPTVSLDYGTSKVGGVALQACAEGCIAELKNVSIDTTEISDVDVEAIWNEVF